MASSPERGTGLVMIELNFETPPSLGLHRAIWGVRKRMQDGATIPEMSATLKPQSVDDPKQYNALCGFLTGSHLPTTLPHAMAMPLHMAILTHPKMPVPALGLVHVRNQIIQHSAIPADAQLSISCRCQGHRVVRSGAEIDLHTTVTVAGKCHWEEITTLLSRTVKGDGSTGVNEPDELRRPDRSITWRVPKDQGRKYARVSGDFNPIHLYPLTARAFGFSRPIVHGMWTLARALAELDPDPGKPMRLDVEFRRPLMLPATVLFSSTVRPGGTQPFQVRSQSGKLHLFGQLQPQ